MSRGSGQTILACCLILALIAPSGLVGRRPGLDRLAHAASKRQPLKRVPQRATIVSVAFREAKRRFGEEFGRFGPFAVRRFRGASTAMRSLRPFLDALEREDGRLCPLRC